MNDAPLVVVDTSVHLASEVYGKSGSPSREVIARGFAGHFEFALSALMLEELARKMIAKGVPSEMVEDYLADLAAVARGVDDADTAGVECRDPTDAFVIAAARACAAWCIVAYDKDLIDGEAAPPGWSPGEFLGRLRERRGEEPGTRFTA